MYEVDDTIVAVSSGAGRGGRGVVRLSGAAATVLGAEVFASTRPLTEARAWTMTAGRCRLDDEATCAGYAVVFRGPYSYTGQDTVELHLPGAAALLELVMARLQAAGARPAGPGEFTARAFLNGRLDLTEAEAVAAVIGARSDAQLRAAQRLLSGQLHQRCARLSGDLAELLALVEAGIDFSEEDIEFASREQLRERLQAVRTALGGLIRDSVTWRQLDQLPRVVLCGPANAGKSSLANRLLGMDRSIVSQIAGTTRDVLTAPLALGEHECMLVDTAGLGAVDDPLGEAAQALAGQEIKGADLLLWVFDVGDDAGRAAPPMLEGEQAGRLLLVPNKVDDYDDAAERVRAMLQAWGAAGRGHEVVPISALTGTNVEHLRGVLAEVLHFGGAGAAGETLALTVRQRDALVAAERSLDEAQGLLSEAEAPAELVALELRDGLDHLGSVSGEVVTDDLLGMIFGRFCVGK